MMTFCTTVRPTIIIPVLTDVGFQPTSSTVSKVTLAMIKMSSVAYGDIGRWYKTISMGCSQQARGVVPV